MVKNYAQLYFSLQKRRVVFLLLPTGFIIYHLNIRKTPIVRARTVNICFDFCRKTAALVCFRDLKYVYNVTLN